jgi:RNA polymerase sigma-70 factor, ECF subfamily
MDAAVLAQAYEEYRNPLIGYMTSLTRNRDDAQDLVHEAYARLAREVRMGRTPIEPRAWLYRVGRNLAVSRGRRHQVAERMQPRLADRALATSAEDVWIAGETARDLRVALAILGPADRTALIMAAEGYTGAEIARALRMSEGAVRTRQCRARAKLRERLSGNR